MEIGIEIAAIRVLRALPRNKSTTTAASSAPRTKCSFTAPTPVRMGAELSRTTSILMLAGKVRFTSSSRLSTVSTTCTVFVPDCLRTWSTTVRSPS